MAAALLRTALASCVSDGEKTREPVDGEGAEVAERIACIEPVLRAHVCGQPVPGSARAKRNLAEHAFFGEGAQTLRAACAQPQRAQRGGGGAGRGKGRGTPFPVRPASPAPQAWTAAGHASTDAEKAEQEGDLWQDDVYCSADENAPAETAEGPHGALVAARRGPATPSLPGEAGPLWQQADHNQDDEDIPTDLQAGGTDDGDAESGGRGMDSDTPTDLQAGDTDDGDADAESGGRGHG